MSLRKTGIRKEGRRENRRSLRISELMNLAESANPPLLSPSPLPPPPAQSGRDDVGIRGSRDCTSRDSPRSNLQIGATGYRRETRGRWSRRRTRADRLFVFPFDAPRFPLAPLPSRARSPSDVRRIKNSGRESRAVSCFNRIKV